MKRIYKIIFAILMCMHITSMQAMLTRRLQMGTRGAPRTAAITQQLGKRSIHGQQPSTSWLARQAAAIAQRATALKNTFSRWWFGQSTIPLQQKELSVPVVQVQQPEVLIEKPLSAPVDQTIVAKSGIQIESEEILAKLKGPNPWNYPRGVIVNAPLAIQSPLAKQIEDFLEKNSVDAIENVVYQLIAGHDKKNIAGHEGEFLLEEMCRRHVEFPIKILPLIEKNHDKIKNPSLLGIVLAQIPTESLLGATNARDTFFERITGYHLIVGYETETIAKLLPKDTTKLIHVIKTICRKISFTIDTDEEKNDRDRLVLFLANIVTQKIIDFTEHDLEFFMSDPYFLSNEIAINLVKQCTLNNAQCKTIIVNFIMHHKDLWKTSMGFYFMEQYASENPKFKDVFFDYVIRDSYLWQTAMGFNFTKQCVLDNPKFKDAIINYIKTEKDFNRKNLAYDFFIKISDGPAFLEILMGLDTSYAQTPSYRHLVEFYRDLNLLGSYSSNPFDIIMSPVFEGMIKDCLDKEKELAHEYEFFYHGRRWQYGFLSDLYDMLYEHKSGRSLGDFSFTQFIEPVIKPHEKFFVHEKQKRQRLIREGNPFPWDTKLPKYDPNLKEQMLSSREQLTGFGNRQALLFLNKFLFGNLNRLGSCSMDYVLTNHNMGEIDFSIQEIFTMFGYGDIYRMYEKELDDLQKKHSNLNEYGELLQILVPKNKVDKCVYYTTSGGPKEEFKIPQGGATTDVKTILNDLNENPQDIAEFVLVETSDPGGGLNPDSGIKVFSHNLVDPAAMAVFKEEQKQLFDKILQACRQKDEQEKKKAVELEKIKLAAE